MLHVRRLTKTYGRAHRHRPPITALDNVDLDVAEGAFTTVLGPSGCGKTTLLRCVAGFETPDSGAVAVAGRTVFDGSRRTVPSHERGVGIVPQDGALFPHLTVGQNVAFGLTGMRRKQRAHRVDETLDLVGLLGFDGRRPHQLSGGQQQRVALARALAPSPRLVLLDEPFSSLDAQLRATLRVEVRDLLTSLGTTAVLVTHDQEEAMELADRLVVMRDGRVIQADDPQDAYRRPRDVDLARFLGDAVIVDGRIAEEHPDRVECLFGSLPIGTWHGQTGACRVLIRPEDIQVVEAADASAVGTAAANGRRHRRGTVTGCSFYGHDAVLRVRLPELTEQVPVRVVGNRPYAAGTAVQLSVSHPVSTYSR